MARTNLTDYTFAGDVTMSRSLSVTGNAAVGTTLAAWHVDQKAIDIGAVGSIFGDSSGNGVAFNLYYDGVNWKYKTTNTGHTVTMGAGGWYWSSAVSGTAGASASVSVKMTLSNTGKLGIGVTPSAWHADQHSIDFGAVSHIRGDTGTTEFGHNVYYDGAWKYKTTAAVAAFSMNAGAWYWNSAGSGTAGTGATLTQKMALSNTGALTLVGPETIGTAAGTVSTTDLLNVYGTTTTGLTFGQNTQPTSGSSMAGINVFGYDSTAEMFAGATINFRAEENWSTTNHGTYVQFRTTNSGNGLTLTEKMRLTGAGYLGINTTAPDGPLHISSSSLLANGTASVILSGENNTERISIRSSSTPVFHVGLYGGTYASKTVATSGAYLGYFQFGGWDGASWHRGAWITAQADENYSTTRRGTSLVFSTALAGADSAVSERVRVMHSGQVLINRTTNTTNAEQLSVEGAIRAKIPTAGLPHATNSESDPAIGLRIHTGGSWALDFGSNNGPAWVQTRSIDPSAPSLSDLYLNPRGGSVLVNSTTSGNGQLFGVYSVSHYGVPPNSGTSTTTTAMRLHMGGVAYDFGVNSTGASWIQVHAQANQAVNYPLCFLS